MANLKINGLDALIDDFAALAQLPDEVMDGILEAGADVITEAQRTEIKRQWRGPHSMEISAKSIKKSKAKKTKDGREIRIYPQGTRKRGKNNVRTIRNAEIAFINEYGAPKRGIAPRPAINTANKKAEDKAVDAGEKVYHQYLDSKKL